MARFSMLKILVPTVIFAGAMGIGAGALAVIYKEPILAKLKSQGILAGDLGPSTASAAQGQVQRYICPMHSQVVQDGPGTCPICFMNLVPLKAHADHDGAVTVGPAIVQNMGVRTARVMEGALRETVRAVGTLVEPEENHTEVSLRVSGWVQKLHANQEGIHVRRGDPLLELYSPELTAAADELIAARKAIDAARQANADPIMTRSSEAVLAAGRRKLELLGLTSEQVEAIASLEKAPATVTIFAPRHGHIARKLVIEGARVNAGESLMEIADRTSMWLQAQVYERQLGHVRVGQKVRITVQALPGRVLEGRIDFIYPHLDPATRSGMVRVTLPNEEHELRENMYASAEIDVAGDGPRLVVPREAVIDTGMRQMVFVAQGNGRFLPRQVTVGRSGRVAGSDGQEMAVVEILSGLERRQEVVTSGQFLLDSESRIQEALMKMRDPGREEPARLAADPRLDAVVAAYLPLADYFGAMQESETPADAAALLKAAEALAAGADASVKEPAARILKHVQGMQGRKIDDQRAEFKQLSQILTDVARERDVSEAVGPVFTFVCPMDDSWWLQASDKMANPFFAREMKLCGEFKGPLKKGPATDTPALPGRQGNIP